MFLIDKQLLNDTHYLIEDNGFHFLLHKNATIPWIIVVPETSVKEVFELSQNKQRILSDVSRFISCFFKKEFDVSKMNVAAIGNIVSQLHIHLVGRSLNDACWPDVVWGNNYPNRSWKLNEVEWIKTSLFQAFLSDSVKLEN